MAIPVGCALGYALGGQIKGTILGWRWAFFLVVPPGILLGLSCLAMRDPPRGQADPGAEATTRPPRWRDYLDLLHIPSYTLNTLGMTALAFALGGLAAWVPVYLEIRKKAGEVTDVGMDGVTFFGILVAGCGLIATLAGGLAGDALRGRFPGSYFLVSGISMLLAFPLILLILVTSFPLAWLWLGLAVFFLFFNTGPTNTILANVSHPAVRAVAFGLNILIIHLLGDAISPFIIGFIYDISSLNAGFAFVSLLVLVGGALWLWGARYLERDTALAPTRLDHERITIPAPAGQTTSPGA
jgi:predicted MFS family arabinose efflux permease